MAEAVDLKALTPESLSRLLSAGFRRKITEEEILTIVDAGDLLSADGTLNLLEFAAYLLKRDKDEN